MTPREKPHAHTNANLYRTKIKTGRQPALLKARIPACQNRAQTAKPRNQNAPPKGNFLNFQPLTLRTLELEKIEKLVALLQDSDLSEIEVEDDTGRLRLAKGGQPYAYHAPLPAAQAPAATPAPAAGTAAASAAEEEGMATIKSPMVGTFYGAPSPDSAAYVEVGAKVGPDTVVCIIEAMKVMNEIQAECKGVVVEVLVENGDAVEFGQPLFKVRPS